MADVIRVPEIRGIEGLLELVTNPTQTAQYLLKLKEMIDAVNGRLGDLDTKAKADDYLRRAVNAESDAQEKLVKAGEYLDQTRETAKTILTEAEAAASATKASQAKLDEDRAVFENAKRSQQSESAAANAALSRREAEVSRRESDVVARENAVAGEESRLQALLADFRSKISA